MNSHNKALTLLIWRYFKGATWVTSLIKLH